LRIKLHLINVERRYHSIFNLLPHFSLKFKQKILLTWHKSEEHYAQNLVNENDGCQEKINSLNMETNAALILYQSSTLPSREELITKVQILTMLNLSDIT
jgi:hypothetical protein